MAYSIEQENPQLHERIKAILLPTQDLLRQTSSSPISVNECINIAYDACVRIATEQKAIDNAVLAGVKRERDEYYDELLKLRR